MSQMTKEQIIDAIIGKGGPEMAVCVALTKNGFMEWSGNQHNESWRWVRSRLEDLELEELEKVYEDPAILTHIPAKMTDHFLPDYHHWDGISERIEGLLTVPIRRVPRVMQWEGDPPFVVLGGTWYHRNIQGALTEDKFQKDLTGAIADFANELNSMGEFRAYPITTRPPTTFGMAYHDWVGASYPFDLRCVIALDEQIPIEGDFDEDGNQVVEAGLKFHITTLIGTEKRGLGE